MLQIIKARRLDLRFRAALVGVLTLGPLGQAALAAAAPGEHGALARPAAPMLDDLVAEALRNNPSIAALRERLAAAREVVAPAGALPDPMVEVKFQEAAMTGFPRFSLGDEPMSMIGGEFRQNLLYPGKRQAARDAASAAAEVREQELNALRREIVRQVRVVYARVYAIDRELTVLSAAREMLDLLAETTAARYTASQASQEAVVKVQLRRLRLGERERDLQAERSVLVAALERLLNRPQVLELPLIGELPPLELPAGALHEAALANSAELAVRRAEIGAAERRLEAARLDRKPNLFIAAGGAYRGSIDPLITVGVGVEWPLRKKQRQLPLVRAAERELEMSRREFSAAESRIREALRGAEERCAQAEEQIRRYKDGLIPHSQAALNAARAEYLAGRGDFSTVIEDFNLWLDARIELASREKDLFAARARLAALASPPPDEPAGGPTPWVD